MGGREYQRVKVTAAPDYPYASLYGFLEAIFPPEEASGESKRHGEGLRLKIDTLATHTTLGPGSTAGLEIPLGKLPDTTTQTVWGSIPVRVLEDARLHVKPLEGPRLPLNLRKIHLMDPDLLEDEIDLSRKELELIPNILGTDILRRGGVQIVWTNRRESYLILEISGEGDVVYMDDPTDE